MSGSGLVVEGPATLVAAVAGCLAAAAGLYGLYALLRILLRGGGGGDGDQDVQPHGGGGRDGQAGGSTPVATRGMRLRATKSIELN